MRVLGLAYFDHMCSYIRAKTKQLLAVLCWLEYCWEFLRDCWIQSHFHHAWSETYMFEAYL